MARNTRGSFVARNRSSFNHESFFERHPVFSMLGGFIGVVVINLVIFALMVLIALFLLNKFGVI